MRYLAILALAACASGENSNRDRDYSDLDIHGEWYFKPDTIEICSDVKVSPARIIHAAAWWAQYINDDYPVFKYIDYINVEDCVYDTLDPWVVRVHHASIEEMIRLNANAWVSYKWDREVEQGENGNYNNVEYLAGCMLYANPINTDWVLRHEIGHCWGWDHTHERKHLMSKNVSPDPSTEGLEIIPSEVFYE